jgi:tetratricopeptide (TPR) repeat protein
MWKNIFGTKSTNDAVLAFKKGEDALGRGDNAAAILHFKKTIEIKPDFAEAYYKLGLAYLESNSTTEIIQCLEKAIELNCKYPDIYFRLGTAYISIGKYTEGNALVEKAAELGSKYAKLWLDKREQIKKEIPDFLKGCQTFYNHHYDLFGSSDCNTMVEYWKINADAGKIFNALCNQIVIYAVEDYEQNYRELIKTTFPGLTEEFIRHNEEIIKKAQKDIIITGNCNRYEPKVNISEIVQNIPKDTQQTIIKKAHKSVEYLSREAYNFFVQEYNTSDIQKIIENYSTYLANAQMKMFHYEDTKNEVIENIIKPLNIYYEDLFSSLFDLLRTSLITDFPKKDYHIHIAMRLFGDNTEDFDELRDAVTKVLARELQSKFIVILYGAIKKHYENVLQNHYPVEYAFFLSNDKDGLEGLWGEIYGRAVELIVMCLQSLGLGIEVIDADKIIYCKAFIKKEAGNVEKCAILGNLYDYSSVVINNYMNTIINAGIHISDSATIGGSIISNPTVIVGNNNMIGGDSKKDEVLQSISNSIAYIQSKNLEVGDNLIGLLQELKQAIETNNNAKQREAKQKFSGFWMAVGNTAKDVLAACANFTKVLEYFGI